MQTGENSHGLYRILDLTRFISIIFLLVHFYGSAYYTFRAWGLTLPFLDTLLFNLSGNLFLLQGIWAPKSASFVLLVISLVGVRGKKSVKLTLPPVLTLIAAGLLFFFLSTPILGLSIADPTVGQLYILLTSIGYLLILAGGTQLSRILYLRHRKDIFNEINESFPQEEKLIENEFSVNFPAIYKFKGKLRPSVINVPMPLRGLLVSGTVGSGKSYFIIRNVIIQHIQKGFTGFIYDFKYPDLTKIAYNTLLKNWQKYPKPPKFYYINFDDLTHSHRCNLLAPDTMHDLTDATESSRTILLALNREWMKKTGDFFVESPINFTTAIFWYLKKYQNGRYCTLPHAIELAQVEYEKLFLVLSLQPEISVLMNPFITAYINGALDQLEGQIASAKIGMARLASPTLYYILSGNDFTLDVNSPDNPKIVCVGNNPTKHQIYGAVLSLCVERMLKLVNQKGKLKSSVVIDEFASLSIPTMPYTLATVRSNLCAITLAIQDFSQLRSEYGRELADVIINVCGNIVSGQMIGDSAKLLSERIGQIIQEMESVTINSNETSLTRSTQLATAIQPSTIANLSSGEFVGAVADAPGQRIRRKAFHAEIINDHEAIRQEESVYRDLPVIRKLDENEVEKNFYQIKQDVKNIIDSEMKKIEGHPELQQLFAKRKQSQKSSMSR